MTFRCEDGGLWKGALLACVLLCGGCGGVAWEHGWENGLRRAAETGRRAVVQFYLVSDADCRKMDAEVFNDPQVQRLLERFVPVRLDAWVHRSLMNQYDLKDVPGFVVLRPDGELAGSTTGPLDAERFRSFLIKHSFN